MIFYLAAYIASVHSADYSSVADFESALPTEQFHYEVLTVDLSTEPKLATTVTEDMIMDKYIENWVADTKALMFEFNDVHNGDIIAIKFQDDGVSSFLNSYDMPALSGETFNRLTTKDQLIIENPQQPSDVFIGHSWKVPFDVKGTVYWGGIEYTKTGGSTRYLSIKVNIVDPIIYTTIDEWEAEVDNQYSDVTTLSWMQIENPNGWDISNGDSIYGTSTGEGEIVGFRLADSVAGWDFGPLPVDEDTAGADHASLCKLELISIVPNKAFSYRVPMDGNTRRLEKCYAAFQATDSNDGSIYYGTLEVTDCSFPPSDVVTINLESELFESPGNLMLID